MTPLNIPSKLYTTVMLVAACALPHSVASQAQSRALAIPVGAGNAASPDGQSIAYMDRGDLAVRDLENSQVRKLTSRGGNDSSLVWHFAWARSGREIFYLRSDAPGGDAEVSAVSLDDGRTRVVAPRGKYRGIADSSPDGRYLLVWTEASGARHLSLLSLEDHSVQKVIEVASNVAKFSADGRYIAYERQSGAGGDDIRIVSRDGSSDGTLIPSSSDEHFLGWTPEGGSIVFTSDQAGTNDMWIVDVADRRLKGEPRLLRKNVGQISGLGFSPAGDLFYRVWAKPQLFTVALDGPTGMVAGNPIRLAVPNVGGHAAPVWSPDGHDLLFKRRLRTDGDNWEALTVLSVGSNTLRTIQPEIPKMDGQTAAGMPGWIDWSSQHSCLLVDGAMYAFGPRPKGAYTIDPADGETTMVVSKPHNTVSVNQAKWLAGGRSIVYLESWTAVVVRDLETGAERRLYDSKAANPTLDSLAVSPDRKFIAFRNHAQGKLLVMPAAGGDARILTSAKGPAGWPAASLAWTPDGRFVIFSDSTDDQRQDLWRVPAGGGPPQKLGLSTDRDIAEIAVSPKGNALALIMSDGEHPPGLRVIDRLVPPVRP